MHHASPGKLSNLRLAEEHYQDTVTALEFSGATHLELAPSPHPEGDAASSYRGARGQTNCIQLSSRSATSLTQSSITDKIRKFELCCAQGSSYFAADGYLGVVTCKKPVIYHSGGSSNPHFQSAALEIHEPRSPLHEEQTQVFCERRKELLERIQSHIRDVRLLQTEDADQTPRSSSSSLGSIPDAAFQEAGSILQRGTGDKPRDVIFRTQHVRNIDKAERIRRGRERGWTRQRFCGDRYEELCTKALAEVYEFEEACHERLAYSHSTG